MAMLTRIEKGNEFNYDKKYAVEIRTSKKLTDAEYRKIIRAIETIADIFDPRIKEMKDYVAKKAEAKTNDKS